MIPSPFTYFDAKLNFAPARRGGRHFPSHSTHKVKVSHSTIHYWIHKYAKLTKDYVESLNPIFTTAKYHHDETELNVHGTGRYFWQTLDEDTRYIVAHLLSADRTTNNAIQVFQQALQKQRPKVLYTNGSYSYDNVSRKFTVPGIRKIEYKGLGESVLEKDRQTI